jgi:hypothetical protein
MVEVSRTAVRALVVLLAAMPRSAETKAAIREGG